MGVPALSQSSADAERAVDFVRGEAEGGDLPGGEVDGFLAGALDGVGVEEDAATGADFAEIRHGLADAGLVVGAHDEDERGVGPDGAGEVVGIDEAGIVHIEIRDLEVAVAFERLKGMEDGVVFGLGGDEMSPLPAIGEGEALDGEVAAFGAAGGEDDFGGFCLQPRGDGVAGGIDLAPGAAALGVEAGGVAERARRAAAA